MGNCLKRSTTDDISLLRGNDSVRESSSDQLTPPNYQVSENDNLHFILTFTFMNIIPMFRYFIQGLLIIYIPL